jgi:hypothetical protein
MSATETLPNTSSINDNNNSTNNVNNNNNNNNNNKDSDMDDDIKLNDNKNASDGQKSKTSSSYYLYKPTPKEEAEKFKPKKMDSTEDNNNSNLNPTSSAKGGSNWNPGNTMEEFDYSQWVKDRLKELLLLMKINNNDEIKIDKIDEMEGTATILFVRGKLKYGYDLHFKLTWKGKIDDKEVEGTLSMAEICPEDDSDEWEFEVKCKQSSSNEGKKALKIIKCEKLQILNIINQVINEFKAKKQI